MGLRVEQEPDEPMRYRVYSETSTGSYLVDVEEDQCNCADYQFRLKRCKHIRAAREVFLDQMLERIRSSRK